MYFRLNYFFRLLILLLFTTAFISAQNKTEKMTTEEKQRIVEKISQLLNNNYVFPDTAVKIERHLKAKLSGGEYDNIEDRKKFAEIVTNDVQSVSRDKHMRVFLRSRQPLSAEEKASPAADLYRQKMTLKEQNYGFTKVEKLKDNVGLLEITSFPPLQLAKEYADLAMKFLSGSDALIIDLRRNGGGNPDLIQYVCSYLFERPTHINSIYERKDGRTEDYVTLEKVDGQKLSSVPVYVLTSRRTFSGGEEFAYDIQTQKRGVLIGETTGGGANPGDMFPVIDDFGIFIPTGRAINPVTKTNWEGTGVIPDINIEAVKALDTAISIARKAAKEHRATREKTVYKLFDEIGASMDRAEKLFDNRKTPEAELMIESALTKAIQSDLLDEGAVNMMGYDYLGRNKYAPALAIFKINAKLFPESANVFDSLAEAYMKSGDNANAVINYRRSLEMDPKNLNAAEALKKLKAN